MTTISLKLPERLLELIETESRARGRRITTLRRYVEALGGELLIFAKVGGRMVRLKDT